MFDRDDEYSHNYHNIRAMKAELDVLMNGESEASLSIINDAERRMLEYFKPQNWNVFKKGNLEIEQEVGFEKYIISIENVIKRSLKGASLFEFYSAVSYIKDNTKKDG